MVKIREAIVVEGRYDKNTLRQIVDAPIFETHGFGIFKNKEQMALLRAAAERCMELEIERRILLEQTHKKTAAASWPRRQDHPLRMLSPHAFG